MEKTQNSLSFHETSFVLTQPNISSYSPCQDDNHDCEASETNQRRDPHCRGGHARLHRAHHSRRLRHRPVADQASPIHNKQCLPNTHLHRVAC